MQGSICHPPPKFRKKYFSAIGVGDSDRDKNIFGQIIM